VSKITLIIGLANPKNEYHATRHNAGEWFIDAILNKTNSQLKPEKKCFGESAQMNLDHETARLFIPTTYMNESGRAVQAIMNYYHIQSESILIAHDDLDLEPGTIRIKKGGGHGGHNGLRDIMRLIGADFYRFRIGIGHPGNRNQVVNYVLSPPTAEDQEKMTQAITHSLVHLPLLLQGEVAKAQKELHTEDTNHNGL